MPNDTINNAIKKASGATDTSNYEEITYEGYGTNGVAVIVEASTDNRNRTAMLVRSTLTKRGGNLGTDGSVSYLFERKGVIVIDKVLDEDISTDYLIVGGGIVGLTTAFLLAKEKLSVTLLDADRIGYGATGRNTGKVTTMHNSYAKIEKNMD